MTARNDFDGTVSDWLDEQAGRGAPDYLDEILAQTTRTRQRPAWSSLGRWLPMQTTLRFAPVPRIAWLLVILGLVVALAVAALALSAGSRRLPAPFGLARNGTLVYGGIDKDIYTFDPVTGASKALVTGASTDQRPWLSPDGTKFFFLRDTTVPDPVFGGPEPMLMLANDDGSDVRALSGPLAHFDNAEWSHDGSKVAVAADVGSTPAIQIFTVGGSSAPLVIDTHGMTALYVSFGPGDRELIFRGSTPTADGIFAVGTDGRGFRTILAPPTQGDDAFVSPDGTKVAYQVWDGTSGVIHVIDAGTGRDSIPVLDPPATPTTGLIDASAVWSPDGARLLFVRYHGGNGFHLAVAPAAGGHVVEIGPLMPSNATRAWAQFSPDGTQVLVHYDADGSTWLLDPSGSTPGHQLPSSMAQRAAWQRLAP